MNLRPGFATCLEDRRTRTGVPNGEGLLGGGHLPEQCVPQTKTDAQTPAPQAVCPRDAPAGNLLADPVLVLPPARAARERGDTLLLRGRHPVRAVAASQVNLPVRRQAKSGSSSGLDLHPKRDCETELKFEDPK
ncbi:hypothetical protein PybrP1_006586 [[Pythium] brassicae (nom. inval.)]|nr:hypothetical protein PybrP1_006586 [[Pythium] brassicae (nom. inval.)]